MSKFRQQPSFFPEIVKYFFIHHKITSMMSIVFWEGVIQHTPTYLVSHRPVHRNILQGNHRLYLYVFFSSLSNSLIDSTTSSPICKKHLSQYCSCVHLNDSFSSSVNAFPHRRHSTYSEFSCFIKFHFK